MDYRAALILQSGLASMVLVAMGLWYGHLRGYFDLFDIVRDYRTKQVSFRLCAEVFGFIASTTLMLILAVKKDGESAYWALAIYTTAYSARSVLGALAQAKAMDMDRRDRPMTPRGRISDQ